MSQERPVLVLMGVCGSGKTTIGRLLADALGCELHDADDLHPATSREKMAAGRPLDDADRASWLAAVRATIDRLLAAGCGGVVACSALKEGYRRTLGTERPQVRLIHLAGTPELLAERLAGRRDHFMPGELLGSQLATLEPPADVLTVQVDEPPEEVAQRILRELGQPAVSS